MRTCRHLIEAVALQLLFIAFRLLPLDMASWLGGWMARAVGPFLSAHRTARENLIRAFPQIDEKEKRRVLTAMWDNLGRVAAELPHLPGDTLLNRLHVRGLETLPDVISKPAVFFSGHLGNWELAYPIAFRHGIPVTLIYRQANNPYADAIVNRIRTTQSTDMFPKGPKGAVRLLRAIKEGKSLAMLIDQKMNDGVAVPFFGRDAMTAPAIAELALRYDMPVIPVRIVRTKGCHFEGSVFPPLTYKKTGDDEKDVLTIMTQINALLENWIRECPEQWFWVHKRWPKA